MDFQVLEPPKTVKNPVTLVFLPPQLCGWWALAALSAEWRDKARLVFADWDLAAWDTGDAIAAEASTLVSWIQEHQDVPVGAFIGAGLGGQVALEAAAFALISTKAPITRAIAVCDVNCKKQPGTVASAKLSALTWRLRRKSYIRAQLDTLGLPQALLPQFEKTIQTFTHAQIEAQLAAFGSWRLPKNLAQVGAPTFVAAGSLDSLPLVESAKAIAAVMPQASMHLIQGAGPNELFCKQYGRAQELLSQLFQSANIDIA